jgi:hypothetical protein
MATKNPYPDFWREQLGNELDEIGPEAFARQHRAVAKDAAPEGHRLSEYSAHQQDRYLREQLLNASGDQIYAYAKKRFGADGVAEQDGEMAQAFGRLGIDKKVRALGARSVTSDIDFERTLKSLHQEWIDSPSWEKLQVLLDAVEEKGGDREEFARKYVSDARENLGIGKLDLDKLIFQGLIASGLRVGIGGLDADWANQVWFLDGDGHTTTVVLFQEDEQDELSLVVRTYDEENDENSDETLFTEYWTTAIPMAVKYAKTGSFDGPPASTDWRKKGERAAKLAGTGPGAPEDDACLSGGEGWFQRQMADDAARHLKVPAAHVEEFKAGYAEGIKKWAKKLASRKWCKQFRKDEGF